MKTLNTGVTTREEKNRIIVNSPYWSDTETDLELTDKQMIKLNIGFAILLFIINMILALVFINLN